MDGGVTAALAVMLLGSTASAAAAPSMTEGAAATPPRRTRLTCARYRLDVEKSAPHAAFDTRLKVGSWGAVPPPWRHLPPHAHLCGADSHGQVVIASSLYGEELEAFYAPLFGKLQFEPLTCTFDRGQTQCRSKHGRDIGLLVTDQTQAIFVLAYVKRERPPPPS
jgi:hypothetical protein